MLCKEARWLRLPSLVDTLGWMEPLTQRLKLKLRSNLGGQTAAVAVSRGGPAVATWIRGQKAMGIKFTHWVAPNPAVAGAVLLRKAFMDRFGPRYTASGAIAAISELKQRTGESVATFLDRVQIGVDMLHYNVPEAERTDAYRANYTRLVVAQFGSGVREDIRARVFGVP